MAKPRGKRVVTATGYVVADKNANGQGSIHLDNKGSYRATYKDPITGKRRTVTAGTKGEAAARREAKLAELEAEKEALATKRPQSVLGDSPTFAQLADWWLDHEAPAVARPTTLRGYAQDITRLNKYLGGLAIRDLDYSTSLATVSSLRKSFGYGTTRNAQARLRQLAGVAVKLGYLAANPVIGLPTLQRTEEERAPKRTLDGHEIAKLLDVLDGTNDLDAGLSLLLTNGLRASEVLGLSWSDIDLKAATATIRRGVTYAPEVGIVINVPKTRRTVGVITLHPVTVRLLKVRKKIQRQQRLAAGPAWTTHRYEGETLEPCFTNLTGGLVREQRLGQALHDRMTEAGLEPSKSTHMGRRSAVTNLAANGVPLHEVADYVGHSSLETTRGYLHDRPARSVAVAGKLAGLYVVDEERLKAEKAEAEKLKTGTTEAG